MDLKQALQILTTVTGEVPLKRADSLLVQQALDAFAALIGREAKPSEIPPE